eukprot:GAFH01002135.1.p9 GENE.GAFH01002135.1~~GAFH01002135.1.p9  ORF type:complete len:55 (-),score=6.09 GAFH01002135.1:119-283(-)
MLQFFNATRRKVGVDESGKLVGAQSELVVTQEKIRKLRSIREPVRKILQLFLGV